MEQAKLRSGSLQSSTLQVQLITVLILLVGSLYLLGAKIISDNEVQSYSYDVIYITENGFSNVKGISYGRNTPCQLLFAQDSFAVIVGCQIQYLKGQ